MLYLGLVASMLPLSSALYAAPSVSSEAGTEVRLSHAEGLGIQQSAKRHVKGSLVDANGEPIIGATIKIVGSSGAGAITDIDGNFQLEAPANATIQVSYIGYTDQQIRLGGKQTQSGHRRQACCQRGTGAAGCCSKPYHPA